MNMVIQKNKIIRNGGCIKSKLDGTEWKWNTKFENLPETYSYVSVMPEVLDQGKSFKCVCYSLTAYLDWLMGRIEGDNVSE